MTIPEILDGIKKLRALVVGDICLDRWCTYDPATSEPSAETGIPRLGIVATEVTPGGGGTVANNLAALGPARVAVLGVRGDDGFGFELDRALTERGIDASLMVEVRRLANLHLHEASEQSNRHRGPTASGLHQHQAPPLGSGTESSREPFLRH